MKLLTVTSAIALAISNLVGAEPDVAALERGYAGASRTLEASMTAALEDSQTTTKLLEPLQKSAELLNIVIQRVDKVMGKPSDPDARLVAPKQFRFDAISAKPPSLKQDPADLYARYHSTVTLRFSTPPSEPSVPLVFDFPVTATPEMKWAFPDTAAVLKLVQADINKRANSVVEIAKKFSSLADQIERKKGR